MKILLANSTCKVGGVSTFMLSMRSALLALGHECELFFFSTGTMAKHLPPDCRAHFGTLADCMRLVEHERFDVVHANNIDWTTGISAIRRIGAKLILTAHKVRENDRTYGWTTANCDALTAVSRGNARELQPFTDVPIQAVLNGIDTAAFSQEPRPASGSPIVAWVGRGGSPLKRLDIFAAIVPALAAAGIRVWVADQHDPEQFAEPFPEGAAALRRDAEKWGPVSFAEMPGFYRAVAASGGCVVCTSSAEGLPLTLLEAQACGCAVIAPDVRGVNEAVFPEQGGTLFPFELEPSQLAELIINKVRDGDHLRSAGLAAAAYVRAHFSREQMAATYADIYRTAPVVSAAGAGMSGVRARLRLSPLVHWRQYLDHRWSVGQRQFGVSQQLADRGEWRLAAGAGRESFATSPTIYLKPKRLVHLLKAQLLALRQVRAEA